MINVVENYKLIEIENEDGEMVETEIDTKDAWNVMKVAADDGDKIIIVNEKDKVEFTTESGEIITGYVSKLTGKGEKTKIKLTPVGSECEQIWSVSTIKDGTLKVVTAEDEIEEN